MHLHMLLFVANFSNPLWYGELYVHFVFACSLISRFLLVPLEEWAHDPENCAPTTFKKIHSFSSLVNAYGALSKRANLGDFAVKELRQVQAKDDAQQAVNAMPPDGTGKSDSAAAGK